MSTTTEDGMMGYDSPSRGKTLKETLSCPVCDNLPVAPVYGCQNGHIICESCKNNVRHCAICRAERFNVHCLVVEDLLASHVLPCDYQDLGCSQPLMNGKEYTSHVINCPFRPIECECKDGSSDCRNQLVPFNDYIHHLKDFHGATRATTKSCFISCDMYGSFSPKYFDCFNHTFILLSHRNQTRFWTWIAMLPTEPHFDLHHNDSYDPSYHSPGKDRVDPLPVFYIRLKLRYKLRHQDVQFITSDVFTPSSPRDLPEEVAKSGRCFELNASTIPDLVPPCVWPQYEPYDEDEGFTRWGYDIEIWEVGKAKCKGHFKDHFKPVRWHRKVPDRSPLNGPSSSDKIIRVPPLRRSLLPAPPKLEMQLNTPQSNGNSNLPESEAVMPLPLQTNVTANASIQIQQQRQEQRPPPSGQGPPPSQSSRPPPAAPSSSINPASTSTLLQLPSLIPINVQLPQTQQVPNPQLFHMDFSLNDIPNSRRWGPSSCIMGDENGHRSNNGDGNYLNELANLERVRALLPLPLDSDERPSVLDGNSQMPASEPEPQNKRARLEGQSEIDTIATANGPEGRESNEAATSSHYSTTGAGTSTSNGPMPVEDEEIQIISVRGQSGVSGGGESKSPNASNDATTDDNH